MPLRTWIFGFVSLVWLALTILVGLTMFGTCRAGDEGCFVAHENIIPLAVASLTVQLIVSVAYAFREMTK
jgi:hypothetical protein